MKIADRVKVTTAPWAGQLGTIESIDGEYHIVRLDSSAHKDDVQELYPNEFEKLAEDECRVAGCDGGFHCPKCGGHHFGTDSSRDEWVVVCHSEYGPCGWSGPYRAYVNNDR